MTKKTMIVMCEIIFALMLFFGGYLLGLSSASEPYTEPTYETVRVESGDRLWSICAQYCPDDIDIRDYISSTMKLNSMKNSDIYPGDVIMVRVYVDD